MSRKSCVFIGLLLIFSLVLISNLKLYSVFPRKTTFANENLTVINHNSKEAKRPDIVINENGDGVIVWQHRNKDWDIYAQLIKDGKKVGDAFKVNKYTLSNQQLPKVAIDGKGNFVVVWQSYFNGGYGSDVYAQRFRADGRRLKYEFRLHSNAKYNQITPDVAMSDDGSFAIAWVSEEPVMKGSMTTYYKNIKAKFFNRDGTKKSDELKVSNNDFELNTYPSVAVNSSGDTMIVWQANNDADWDIYSQVFDMDGEKKSSANTLVYFDAKNDQTQPGVTETSADDFIVVWKNLQPHSMFDRIMVHIAGQMFNRSGAKSGNMFNVNEPELYGRHSEPSISSIDDLSVVAWQAFDDSQWKILYQYLDKQNNPVGEIEELSDSNGSEWIWDVDTIALMDSDGKLNVSWTQLDLKKNRKNVIYIQRNSESQSASAEN